MSYFVYITAFILALINGFSKKKSRVITIIFLVLMLLMFCEVTTPNYHHQGYFRGDNEVYEQMYKSLSGSNFDYVKQSSTFEKGFVVYSYIFATLGVPYNIFMAITFLIGMLLCFFTVRRITDNYSLFLVLYFCYYFLYDIQQIRNFIAISISIFALRFLKDRHVVIYILLILLASMFHFSALAFLPFLLIYLPNYKYFAKLFIELSAILFAGLSILNLTGNNVIKQLARVINLGSYNLYVGDNFNALRPFIELVLFAYLAILVYTVTIEEQDNEWASFTISITAVSFLFLPLMLISMTMDRILRPLLILDYAVISNSYSFIDKDNLIIYGTRKNLYIIGLFVVIGIMTYFYSKNLFAWIFDSNHFIYWLDSLMG
ncbi:MAG: EpsG family protein [Lactimicrobium sp.]|jgi:hypothetical protein|uniref:EpsG family protein n=1 Tax=Lactimicrobium sp. TaxID=2563780 RepID=UPI002F35D268